MGIAEITSIIISMLALGISVAAFKNSKRVRSQDLRMSTRKVLDDALASARSLPTRIDEAKLQTNSQLALRGMNKSGAAQLYNEETERWEGEASKAIADLEGIDTDLSSKSDKELEIIALETNRLCRDVGSIHQAVNDRIAELEKGEKRSREVRREFREEVQSKKPMGGLFDAEQ